MKIYLMTDMEGVAGILNHDDWVLPTGRFYDQGRRLLAEEVNMVSPSGSSALWRSARWNSGYPAFSPAEKRHSRGRRKP